MISGGERINFWEESDQEEEHKTGSQTFKVFGLFPEIVQNSLKVSLFGAKDTATLQL